MNLSRRDFLWMASAATVVSATGCDLAPELIPELKLAKLAPPSFWPAADPFPGPYAAPAGTEKDAVSHALSRMAYGPAPGDYARVSALGVEAYLEEQLSPDAIDDTPCDQRIRLCETIFVPGRELYEYQETLLLEELTRATLLRAVYSKRQLYEVMVGFWTDHFNIDSSKGDCQWLKTMDDREVIRKHALGKFPELLRAVVLSPAMLWYLDGRVNRRATEDEQPNENYARELLELHSLGVHAGYSQQDVMEVARCLTGWTVQEPGWLKRRGRVKFNPDLHDDGAKEVLGVTVPSGLGEGDVERVIEIVMKNPETGHFIATKLCRRFVSDTPGIEIIDTVASAFRKSEGDIPTTLRALFAHPEFLQSRDAKLKRPFRFAVSALRATGASGKMQSPVSDYLVRMGHAPFQYPTPEGYADEAAPWLGTLFWRWHMADALANGTLDGVEVDWDRLRENFGDALASHLLARAPSDLERNAYNESGPAALIASPAFQRY
jgi:uncharacterized protein (DUF1800 family)